MKRRTSWWPVLGASLVAGLTFVLFSRWAYDDPFITFRYARNIRSGVGFVYNAGERTLSTTAPFYALLLAGLSYIWPDLPSLSNLISAVSLGLGGFFLHLIGKRWEEPLAGLVAGALFSLFPLMVSTFGAETCFYVMLSLGAFALHAGEQYYGAMVLAAVATLTRSDGVLVGLILGLDFLIDHRRIPWGPALLFACLIAPWYLFSWYYFGSPLPATLAAKQHQAEMAISEGFGHGFWSLLRTYAQEPFFWLHGTAALVGTIYAAFRNQRWLSLLAWGVLYFVSYTVLGVSRYFWYYVPPVTVLLSAVGLGLTAAKRWLPFRTLKGWRGLLAFAAVLSLMLYPQVERLGYLYQHPDQRVSIYREVGTWLAEHTPPEATVGTLEVGIIGYYAQRRMIGFAGLIQPPVAQKLSYGTTYRDAAAWAIKAYQPDYLVLNPDWFPGLVAGDVSQTCEPLKSFAGASHEYGGKMIVYACSEGARDPNISNLPAEN